MTIIQRENTKLMGHETRVNTLCRMMTYKRKAGSLSERKFISKYIKPLPGAKQDEYGNWLVRVGDSAIMYSCHTDSVHSEDGKQQLKLTANILSLAAARHKCLGADDAAGVWIMREMVLAKKPGLYVFHRDEESGGKGSTFIAEQAPETVDGIKAAIAFDRRGRSDVITHQAGGRCASDAFGDSLAMQLGGSYRKSSGGIFTDTANYTDLIGECTNISVGYDHEHTAGETLDIDHIQKVRHAMLNLDESKLVFARKPGEIDPTWRSTYYGGYSSYDRDDYSDGGAYGGWAYDEDQDLWVKGDQTIKGDKVRKFEGTKAVTSKYSTGSDYERIVSLIKDNPREIADLLEEYGFSLEDVRGEIYQRGGVIRSGYSRGL